MALVGEAGFLGNQGQGQSGSSHQCLCPLQPPLRDVTLRSDPDRLLERAAEMIGTETGDRREVGQAQPLIEMLLDVVMDSLQALS